MPYPTLLLLVLPLVAPVVDAEFDHANGAYSKSVLKDDFPGLIWEGLRDRAEIHHQRLRIAYPKGCVGSRDSGCSFMVALPPRDQYFCEYRVRFSDDFDFSRGGKLPGLAGGEATSGNVRPNGNGWSVRYMWRERGRLYLYLYHMNQPDKSGEYISLNVKVKRSRWYRLTQRVRVNSPGKSDGQIDIWVDGIPKAQIKNLKFRVRDLAPVDRFYFSTFFGGSKRSWAPSQDVTAEFDSVRVLPFLADPSLGSK